MSDNVEHPSHYCEGREYEPVNVILDWELDFLLGNALKYISRCGRKGSEEDAIEDLEKAVWYIEKRISVMRAGSGKVELPEDNPNDWTDRVNTTTPSTINPMPSITCDTTVPTPIPDDIDGVLPSYDGDIGSPFKSITVDTTVTTPAPSDTSLFVMESSGETRLRAI